MHTPAAYKAALDLRAEGLNHTQIGGALGLPRTTVRDWCRGITPRIASTREPCAVCGLHRDDAGAAPESYAYLLGMYLGDGCIDSMPRTWRLRIAMDAGWPGIIADCRHAMSAVLPANRVTAYRPDSSSNAIVAMVYSSHLPCLFPQHGRGRKHLRRIELAQWQQELVVRESRAFLRGLVHSDGCRVVNRVRSGGRTYSYPRYNFTNSSRDIRSLFATTCDALGVRWRPMGPRNISVARSESVALLDEFIGPKY